MGVNLSIKDVPEDQVERLRERAKSNHRSLQGELRAILDQVAPVEKRTISFDELIANGRRLGLSTPDESTTWIREDRDR